MTERTPYVYLARMQTDWDFLEPFLDWYRDKHTLDLIDAGFLSCQYYLCRTGYPNVCNIYEIPDPALFSGNTYQTARTVDADRPHVLSHIVDRSNTVYEQLALLDADGKRLPVHPGSVDAPLMSSLFFTTNATPEAVAAAGADRGAVVPAGHGGLRRARLCRFAAMHPNNPRDPRDWLVVLEWEAGSDAVAGAEAVREQLEKELGGLSDVLVLAGDLTCRRVGLPG